MSDARAATDGDLEYWRDTVRSARATNTGTLLAATASMEALLARISADAARIRELEARQVPDGWQVVPKEPTEEMVEDAAKAIHDTDDMADTSWPVKDDDTGYRGGGGWVRLCRDPEMFREAARAAHSAMLAAAPRP